VSYCLIINIRYQIGKSWLLKFVQLDVDCGTALRAAADTHVAAGRRGLPVI